MKMKKIICFIILTAIFGTMLMREEFAYGSTGSAKASELENASTDELQKSISSKLIRFHVIANSDTAEDQALKIKVRDRVLEFITPKLSTSNSIEESRSIIKKNDKAIKSLAEKVIKESGYNYKAATVLSLENFPVKSYGNITLPQGKYEAYRIIIGSGKGQNWWCVMFPPLCFVDLAKGEVAEKETAEAMKRVLNKDEFEAVNNEVSAKQIKIRFKVVDIFKDLKYKLKNIRASKNA